MQGDAAWSAPFGGRKDESEILGRRRNRLLLDKKKSCDGVENRRGRNGACRRPTNGPIILLLWIAKRFARGTGPRRRCGRLLVSLDVFGGDGGCGITSLACRRRHYARSDHELPRGGLACDQIARRGGLRTERAADGSVGADTAAHSRVRATTAAGTRIVS